jgi:hypothetical protein
MTENTAPNTHAVEQPKNSFRVTITLSSPKPRIDQVLMEELRKQSLNLELKNISRAAFKELFKNKKIRIKGQSAVPSSALAKGTTYVDIIGFGSTH